MAIGEIVRRADDQVAMISSGSGRIYPGGTLDGSGGGSVSGSRMRWLGLWAPGFYELNDVVRDGLWTMIVINPEGTSEKPAPIPTGDEEWMLPDAPTWASTSGSFSVRWVGLRATALNPGYVNSVRWWDGDVIADVTSDLFLRVNPGTPDEVFITVATGLVDSGADAWSEAPFSVLRVPAGTTVDAIRQIRNESTSTVTTATYNYQKPTNPSTPASGQIDHAGSAKHLLRVHKTDDGGTSRAALLGGIDPGDRISVFDTAWTVTGPSRRRDLLRVHGHASTSGHAHWRSALHVRGVRLDDGRLSTPRRSLRASDRAARRRARRRSLDRRRDPRRQRLRRSISRFSGRSSRPTGRRSPSQGAASNGLRRLHRSGAEEAELDAPSHPDRDRPDPPRRPGPNLPTSHARATPEPSPSSRRRPRRRRRRSWRRRRAGLERDRRRRREPALATSDLTSTLWRSAGRRPSTRITATRERTDPRRAGPSSTGPPRRRARTSPPPFSPSVITTTARDETGSPTSEDGTSDRATEAKVGQGLRASPETGR